MGTIPNGLKVVVFFAVAFVVAIVATKDFHSAVAANFIISIFAFFGAMKMIPGSAELFMKAKCYGEDINKPNRPKIPESQGLVVGSIYLISMSLFIPFPYEELLDSTKEFPHNEYVEYVCGLLVICFMILLGLADDILELRWRERIVIPSIAFLPLLMVYHVNKGLTSIMLPNFLHETVGRSYIDLGYFYYVAVCLTGIFCTNSINILAGVNGLEAGQSLVIGISIMINDWINIWNNESSEHQLSLYFITPFVAVTLALTYHNWYPASVFVGDTFCYFAGVTFIVCAILGHFTKTIYLFFIPQLLNFVYSLPQLLKFIPCPRHRMPRLNEENGKLKISYSTFKPSELKTLGRICFGIFKTLRIVKVIEEKDGTVKMSNLTLINYFIYLFGEMREDMVTISLLIFQTLCSCMGFYIRYVLAPKFVNVSGKIG